MNIISTIFLLFSVLAISFPIQAAQDFDEADLEAGIQASLASYYGHHFEEEIEKPFQPEEIKAYESAEGNFLFKYAASHITTVWLSDRTYYETSPEIIDIFLNPNYQKWQALLTTSTSDFSKTPSALDVVFLLYELQRTAVFGATHFRQHLEKQISQTFVFLANQALLQIFSGCWGFSKGLLPREIESQLKEVLHETGRSNQQFQKDQDTFFNTVQNAFQKNGYCTNPSLQNHFLTVFTYLCEGYTSDKPQLTEDLMELGRGLFMSLGFDKQTVDKFMLMAGYYAENGSLTILQLLETASYKSPSFVVSIKELNTLRENLRDLDLSKFKTTDSYKVFLDVLFHQPLTNIYSQDSIKAKLIDKVEFLRNKSEKDKKKLSEFIFESLFIKKD